MLIRLKPISFFAAICVLLSVLPATADEPVVFNRDTIYIIPKAAPNEPAVQKDAGAVAAEQKPGEAIVPSPRRKKEVMVNIRPESFLQQPGVFNLQPFMDAGGLLVLLPEPRKNALKPNNIYASVDVVFIAADGTIIQIAPAITPSDLEGSIDTKDNTFALLFLKKNDTESKDIRPGDTVQHSLFRAKPVILTQ